ncbi:MAG: TonB-dependent receptor [Bacteroides sp.]|nr:TonB-dependent receptor [Bacteroides sp.]MCM1413750.1 TonB-dependent receptor [Bacteroides sp.]MCM1472231.1 TonB-dependent receptor [Bacteroides sp.]
MRIKLFLLMLLTATFPLLAQQVVTGKVVDASTGTPVQGAAVMLNDQGTVVLTGPDGGFSISDVKPGNDVIIVAAYGYNDLNQPLVIYEGSDSNLGVLRVAGVQSAEKAFSEARQEILFDQNALEDEEGNAQSVGVLSGASDNVYYNASNYNFSVMRFRMRGYDSYLNTTYINGIPFNDLARGRFNYSTLGGMNRAFRNRTNTLGMGASTYGFGNIGGSANINTITENYASGFNGSVAYTNAAYMLRAMLLYSTGINKHGWGVTVGAIGRYANEGVIPGTFYNSAGYFLSVEKQFNSRHSLTLTTFGAPTQRATNSATYLEAYDLADNNLYNPNWGYQDGKKRSSKIVETFDPTAILNWIWKPKAGTSLNTGFAFRSVNYSSSALNWYNARDPRPDYYRYLPSYYSDDQQAYDLYTDLWHTTAFRQLDWDAMYQTNYLNNEANRLNPDGTQKGSTYILENRHSNQLNFIFNSVLNHQLNEQMSLQAGVSANYTRAHYYKTIRDLLGGEFWLDIDQFSERDYPDNPELLQNNLNDPNRKVTDGDTFGYNYYINAIQAKAWIQNMITLPKWDINYGVEMSYTQFQRDGKMRNGRAPQNSYGKGVTHRFDNGAIKAGATYKFNGRNFLSLHGEYSTMAPLFEYAYISPRIKDDAIDGLTSTRIVSVDLSYNWNYRRFRGSIGAFYTDMYDMTERSSYYDDQYSTFMNYVLKGVKQNYKGIEFGMAFKITPSLTATAAGTIASYRYKNNPTGVRSYENGMAPDTATTVYIKNYHIGGTPQTAFNVGLDWAAPHMWFFNINASWMGNAYVNLSPIRHEALTDLWTAYPDAAELEKAVRDITAEDKLNNAFTLNASVGKLIYLNRSMSLNINVNVDNILNKKNIMTYGYQQGRFDYTDFNRLKYPNKYYFAQGIKVFVNVGLRF